jgi:hypothetical protein
LANCSDIVGLYLGNRFKERGYYYAREVLKRIFEAKLMSMILKTEGLMLASANFIAMCGWIGNLAVLSPSLKIGFTK